MTKQLKHHPRLLMTKECNIIGIGLRYFRLQKISNFIYRDGASGSFESDVQCLKLMNHIGRLLMSCFGKSAEKEAPATILRCQIRSGYYNMSAPFCSLGHTTHNHFSTVNSKWKAQVCYDLCHNALFLLLKYKKIAILAL